MKHSIIPIPAPALPVPSNEIAGSSRTTSNILAASSPKVKSRKSNSSEWCASKIKKAKAEDER